MRNPFRYINSSPEVIRLVVMMYIRYPRALWQGEDILFERAWSGDEAYADHRRQEPPCPPLMFRPTIANDFDRTINANRAKL